MKAIRIIKTSQENRYSIKDCLRITSPRHYNKIKYNTIATNTEDPELLQESIINSSPLLRRPSKIIVRKAKVIHKNNHKLSKTLTPKIRLKFYIPEPQVFRRKRTLIQLLSSI